MKATTWILLIGLTAGPLPGCKKRPPQAGPTAAQPEVKWPAKPADGAPVALTFVAMAHKDKVFGAELRVFSFSEKAVRGLKMTFHSKAIFRAIALNLPQRSLVQFAPRRGRKGNHHP